jgi:2-amino-4-hydroxy-6-hydroxymethyldihydropteridine diphosphokinase/dihydroneopterin aldolase
VPDSLAVTLRGLRFHALVGILPHEREIPQPLEVDVTAWRRDGSRAGAVLDYRALHSVVAERVAAGEIGYLEDFAHDVAERALALNAVARVRVAVRKPHVPLGAPLDHAEIVVERGAASADFSALARQRAYVALGSNMGDRAAYLELARGAIDALPLTAIAGASGVEETPPIGPVDQGPFLNQMLAIDTALDPETLLDALLAIERAAGRDRATGVRWGPRTLDCDIVLFADRTMRSARLTLPHPGLTDREFWRRELHELGAGVPA